MAAMPPPTPELTILLCSLEWVTLKHRGIRQLEDVEVKPPPSSVGNPEALRDSEGGPQTRDIT
jgi:hypothetical protein